MKMHLNIILNKCIETLTFVKSFAYNVYTDTSVKNVNKIVITDFFFFAQYYISSFVFYLPFAIAWYTKGVNLKGFKYKMAFIVEYS